MWEACFREICSAGAGWRGHGIGLKLGLSLVGFTGPDTKPHVSFLRVGHRKLMGVPTKCSPSSSPNEC